MKKVVLFVFTVLTIFAAEAQLPFIAVIGKGLHTDNVTAVTNDSKRLFRKPMNRKRVTPCGSNGTVVYPGKNKFLRGVPN